jgi:putative drug exporter of the RND superfamily
VAAGVLIDTFVVRSILVPAITTVAGDRAWWPSGTRAAVARRAWRRITTRARIGHPVPPMAGRPR